MGYKRGMILFAALTLLMTAFIWSNSLQTRQQSSEQSSELVSILKPILDPNDKVDTDIFHARLRKCAHFVEFGFLGFCIAGFCIHLGRMRGRWYLALPMLIALLVAVMDEYIQTFTGRGSKISDVWIDFFGAISGIAIAAMLEALGRRTKKEQKE